MTTTAREATANTVVTDLSTVPRTAHPSLRVLVAEDNELNSHLLKEMLSRRGHVVRVAADGLEALRLIEEDPPDLILLDIHMPGLDGFGVIRAIRGRKRETGGHLRVIAVTARSRVEDRVRCLLAGIDDVLVKPIQAEKLDS